MRQWQRAMEAIESLLSGCSRNPLPPATAPPPVTAATAVADSAAALFGLAAPSPSKVAASASTGTPSLVLPFSDAAFLETGASQGAGGGSSYGSRLGGMSQYSPAGGDGSLDEGLFAAGGGAAYPSPPLWRGGATGSAGTRALSSKPPFADELDWTLPLRQGATPNGIIIGSSVADRRPAGAAAPPPSPLVRAGMDLGLLLLEGCVAAGMASVAKHVVRMLMNQVWGGERQGDGRLPG